jgi:hypothetical protein
MDANQIPSPEGILANSMAIPYNFEIKSALRPHCEILRKLVASLGTHGRPPSYAHTYLVRIPTTRMSYGLKDELRFKNGNGSIGPFASCPGDLIVADQARVINWIDRHVTRDKKNLHNM